MKQLSNSTKSSLLVGLHQSALTVGLSPPLHWVLSSVAEELDSRVAVTTADVALEGSVSADSGDALLPASSLSNFCTMEVVFSTICV